MSDLTRLIEAHPEGEAQERFRFEFAGGAMAVTAAQDRLTPYGGAAAWSHCLEKLGVIADLARRFPLMRTSQTVTHAGTISRSKRDLTNSSPPPSLATKANPSLGR